MAGKSYYTPSPEFPHIPKDLLVARLARRSVEAEGGCRLWQGCRHNPKKDTQLAGILRINTPEGRSLCLFTHKLAWWAEHGVYPKSPALLLHECGHRLCLTPGHMRLDSLANRRGLTDAQVVEARALFWLPYMRLNDYQRRAKAPSAELMASWRLGMSVRTIRQVVAGAKVVPAMWQGYAQSREQVLSAVAACRDEAASRQADRGTVWSQESLAARYGISLACMHRLLHGIGYRHVPMPPEADGDRQKAARDALNLARERSRAAAAPSAGAAAPAPASPPAG